MLMGWAPQRDRARRRRPRLGRRRRTRQHGARNRARQGGRAVAVVSDESKREFCLDARRRRRDQPAATSPTGARCPTPRTARPTASGRKAPARSARRSGTRSASVQPADRVRASRRSDLADVRVRVRDRRDDCDLRRHDRLQRHARSPLSLDAAEAVPGQPSVQRRAGARRSRGSSPTGAFDPCLSQTYDFDEIPECHQLMLDNKHPYGNMAVLVNATKPGQGAS